MTVATRPQSTPPSPPPLPAFPQFQNFRPLRYQTTEALDRFFGTTPSQRREQRLRVRESDGQVYFDWIEKDEWQHLLATGSLTSPSSPDVEQRRRSSGMTCLTLASPLGEASAVGRRASVGGESPLSAKFEGEERRGRKCTARQGRVDDRVPLSNLSVDDESWINAAQFKAQSDDGYSPCEGDSIRIARLPLSRRKLDPHTLDQAFGTPSTATTRTHKPATLVIPTNHQDSIELDASPTDSSFPNSPATTTFDSAVSGARRGTFGALLPPAPLPARAVVGQRARRSSDTRVATPPASAAMEFLASPTPTSTFGSQPAGTAARLRHAASFDTKTDSFPFDSDCSAQWGQRQRWRSAEAAPTRPTHEGPRLRSVRSVASLHESGTTCAAVAVEREKGRRTSTSSDGSSASETCYTPLAPRVGAKRFDKTRLLHLDPTPSAAGSPVMRSVDLVRPMRDPLATKISINTTPATSAADTAATPHSSVAETQTARPSTTTSLLRTGPEVYIGLDIPCASIHLHSDPEDNVEPALALTLSASKLRKLKKSKSAAAATEVDGGQSVGHLRSASAASHSTATAAGGGGQRLQQQGGYAKGSSRWWSHILHG